MIAMCMTQKVLEKQTYLSRNKNSTRLDQIYEIFEDSARFLEYLTAKHPNVVSVRMHSAWF